MKTFTFNLLVALAALIFIFPTDGFAQSWQTLNANSLNWRFEDMHFIDTDIGWAVDGGGQILKTTDGGQTWTQQYFNANHYFRSLEFYNDQIGFAGTLSNSGSNGELLRTTDGGETWTNITTNFPVSIVGICGIAIADENTIFISGVFYGFAYIMKSLDQGNSWEYTDMGNYANGLVDIYFKDPNNGWAVGQSPQANGLRAVILGTTNGGNTWNVLATTPNTNQRAWKIQQLNDDVLYVSVEDFQPTVLEYFKSTDGGESWELKTAETSDSLGTIQGIGFLNEDIGWLGGFGQLFYETLDGGETWEYKPLLGSNFNRFQRVNDTLMYTSGVNIYRYADTSLSITDFDIKNPTGHTISIAGGNPISGTAIIDLNLVNYTFTELSVYNSSGQRVDLLYQEMSKKGEHKIKWDTSKLPSGTYFLALYTYHGYQSIKVAVK